MPGLELTPAILGKPVIPSPGYSLQTARSNNGTPTGNLQEFVDEFERTGMAAADIYDVVRINGTRTPIKISFLGCNPGSCRKNARNSSIEIVPHIEWRRYASSGETIPSDNRIIARQKIGDVNYFAELSVHYDYRKRVRKYKVVSYRDPITAKEKSLIEFDKGTFGLDGIAIFSYGKIVAVDVEASTFKPRPGGVIDPRKEL
ncbi:MAG: hypothetical protein AAF429_03415 [Pseudomonadota bacterium]